MEDIEEIARDISRQQTEENKRDRTENNETQGRTKAPRNRTNQTTIEDKSSNDDLENDSEDEGPKVLNSTQINAKVNPHNMSLTVQPTGTEGKLITNYFSVPESPFSKNQPQGIQRQPSIPETPDMEDDHTDEHETSAGRKDQPILPSGQAKKQTNLPSKRKHPSR